MRTPTLGSESGLAPSRPLSAEAEDVASGLGRRSCLLRNRVSIASLASTSAKRAYFCATRQDARRTVGLTEFRFRVSIPGILQRRLPSRRKLSRPSADKRDAVNSGPEQKLPESDTSQKN